MEATHAQLQALQIMSELIAGLVKIVIELDRNYILLEADKQALEEELNKLRTP